MNWMDYREKLGIGFNDLEKSRIFITRVLNTLELVVGEGIIRFEEQELFKCLNILGIHFDWRNLPMQNYVISGIFCEGTDLSLNEFLSRYIALLNSVEETERQNKLKNILIKNLKDAQISFELMEDSDGCFIFPRGAKEFDDALVSDVLIWLEDYPQAYKTFSNALRQYCGGNYIRDVADNLRKSLEDFLKEFLKNDKGLEANKKEIGKYFGSRDIDSMVISFFDEIIKVYKRFNDESAKHADKVDERLLEFLLYQTGILIRMILVVSRDGSG